MKAEAETVERESQHSADQLVIVVSRTAWYALTILVLIGWFHDWWTLGSLRREYFWLMLPALVFAPGLAMLAVAWFVSLPLLLVTNLCVRRRRLQHGEVSFFALLAYPLVTYYALWWVVNFAD